MELFFYFSIFLFGLIVGSFLNVVIFRLETGEQLVSGRSHCRRCNHVLEWHDLVPVLSFLALGGKCRYCKKPLSIQYPLVEIATGILFATAVNFSVQGGQFLNSASNFDFFCFPLSTLYFLFIISSLIVIFVYDLKHYIIPDKIVYSAILVSIIYLLFFGIFCFGNCQPEAGPPQAENLFGIWDLRFGILKFPLNNFIAAFVASSFFLSIALITKGAGMGGGDVKLGFLMGLALSWPKILLALFLSFTLGAICGIIFVIAKKKALKSAIPFGPFLALGTFAALFWGEEIIRWYGNYIF